MRVHDVIGAYYAIDACRMRAPGLREHYQPETQARQALDVALAALGRFAALDRLATAQTKSLLEG